MRAGLNALEDQVTKLWSPKFPFKFFGQSLNETRRKRGEDLFNTDYNQRFPKSGGLGCVHCHGVAIRTGDREFHNASQLIPMKRVGTDPTFNNTAIGRTAPTDMLEGRNSRLFAGRELGPQEPAATALKKRRSGSIIGSFDALPFSVPGIGPGCPNTVDADPKSNEMAFLALGQKSAEGILGMLPQDKDDAPLESDRTNALVTALSVYKARPLNGIWASLRCSSTTVR